jgi:hypothetical protein
MQFCRFLTEFSAEINCLPKIEVVEPIELPNEGNNLIKT